MNTPPPAPNEPHPDMYVDITDHDVPVVGKVGDLPISDENSPGFESSLREADPRTDAESVITSYAGLGLPEEGTKEHDELMARLRQGRTDEEFNELFYELFGDQDPDNPPSA